MIRIGVALVALTGACLLGGCGADPVGAQAGSGQDTQQDTGTEPDGGSTGSGRPATMAESSSGVASGGAASGETADSPGSTGAEPEPHVSPEAWRALQGLRYDAGEMPPDPTNAWANDPAAAVLGQRLFFDPRFSGPLLEGDNDGSAGTLGHAGEVGRVSCASCHVPAAGFVDDRSPYQQVSLASGWVLRRTPTLLEVGRTALWMWDGRRDTAHGVLQGVLENALEFNSSRLYFAQQLARNHGEEFAEVFDAVDPDLLDEDAYPQQPAAQAGCPSLGSDACAGRPGDAGAFDGLSATQQQEVTRIMVQASKALGAYLRLLRCGPSRFDAWLDGDASALSDAEIRGAVVFVGRGECSSCHAGPTLTDGGYYNVGVTPRPVVGGLLLDAPDLGAVEGIAAALQDPLNSRGPWSDGDDGRLPREVASDMLGAFKTPTLRCIANQPSFLHTGHLRSLRDAVAFFGQGGDPFGYPGVNVLHPVALTPSEIDDVTAFLEALEGEGPPDALLGPL